MVIECGNCGAPLDAPEGVTRVKCAYCGRTNKVGEVRTLMPHTPPGWQPPAQWKTPADHLEEAVRDFRSGFVMGLKMITRKQIAQLLAGVCGLLLVGAAVLAGWWLWPWDERSTLTCHDGDEITLENVDARVRGQYVVVATKGCRIRIVDSTLRGKVGLEAQAGSIVVLENTAIVAESWGAVVSGDAQLEMDGACRIEAGKTALFGRETSVTIPGATIKGGDEGIRISGKLVVRKGTVIQGGKVAIVDSGGADIRLYDARVQAQEVALRLGAGTTVTCRNTPLVAKRPLELLGTGQGLSFEGCLPEGTKLDGSRKR